MKYYIRDDDTSYFTTIEDLTLAYSKIWEYGPVNLAIIPYCVKTDSQGVLGLQRQDPEVEYFIGDNSELVNFLHTLIKEGKITIMLHGFNHYYLPTYSSKYPFGIPEFIYSKNQFHKISKGKKVLEELFNVEIKWFIPPSNALTNETIEVCDKLKLNIPMVKSLKERRFQSLLFNPQNLILNRLNKLSNKNNVLNFRNHKEILCTSYTSVSDLTNVKKNRNMVIATHYWEVNKYPEIKNKILSDINEYGKKIFSLNEL